MLRSTLRWALILTCLFALGPALCHLLRRVHDASGGDSTTLLVSARPAASFGLGLLSLALAALVGLLGAHAFSIGTGLTSAGITLAWARWGLGTADGLARLDPQGSYLSRQSLEAAFVLAAAALISGGMVYIAARRQPPLTSAPNPGKPTVMNLFATGEGPLMKTAMSGIVVGVVVGGIVAWLVAFSSLRGQTLMAALCGALAAGAASQLVAASMRCTLTPLVPVLSLLVLAVAGPLLAPLIYKTTVLDASNQNTLFGLARPISLDWAAGALLGGPIGLGWAGAMLDARAIDD